MIENRMKNAMQQKLPDVPEGFDARSDMQLVRLTAGEEKKTRLRAGYIIALALVLVLGIVTGLAAANERVNTWLYEFWPEAAIRLMPANTSCEKEGIRLELVSAAVEGEKLNIVFSLEDLQGNRISEKTEAEAMMEWEAVETRYDAAQNKMFFTWSTDYEYHTEPDNGTGYVFELSMLQNHRHLIVDLLPLLEKYGSQSRTVQVQDEDQNADDPISKYIRVLDYHNSLDIPLSDYVMLSGIGVEDGTLRVQFHYPVHHREFVRILRDASDDPNADEDDCYKTVSYSPYECYAFLYEAAERDETKPLSENIEGPLPLSWGRGYEKAEEVPEWDANVSQSEWNEFQFGIRSGLTETQKLEAEIREWDPPIISLWTVEVPPRLIRNLPTK